MTKCVFFYLFRYNTVCENALSVVGLQLTAFNSRRKPIHKM